MGVLKNINSGGGFKVLLLVCARRPGGLEEDGSAFDRAKPHHVLDARLLEDARHFFGPTTL